MDLPLGLRARDPQRAARVTGLIAAFAAVIVLLWTVLLTSHEVGATGYLTCAGSIALLTATAVTCLRGAPRTLERAGILLAVPTVGGVIGNLMNYTTTDTSAAAQVFLVVPVLLGATQLRAWGAWLATVITVGGNALVVGSLSRGQGAVADVLFVGAALCAVTAVLVHTESERDRLFVVLRDQARADGLTGLLRRRAVDDALGLALQTGGAALLLVDVDDFKQVNDVHGHTVGDDALVHLSGLLRGQLRHTDCVVGRIGGDELAMVLPGCTAEAAAERACELVTAVRATPLTLADGTVLSLTVSVGVAHSPTHAAELRSLYEAADAALYRVKRAGRNGAAMAPAPAVTDVPTAPKPL